MINHPAFPVDRFPILPYHYSTVSVSALPRPVVRARMCISIFENESDMSEMTAASINERAADEFFRRGRKPRARDCTIRLPIFMNGPSTKTPTTNGRVFVWRSCMTVVAKTPRQSSYMSG